MHARHHRARQIGRSARVFHLWRTRRVVMIENDELQRKLIGKLRDIFGPRTEGRAHVGVDALEVVEESRRGDVAGDAEAWPVGNRAIRLQENAALVITDVFLVIGGWDGEWGRE